MSDRAEFWIKGRKRLAEPFQYSACGLNNIFLLNGVTIEDTSYGPMVNIEKLNGLITRLASISSRNPNR
jgi:hypothetical protein